MKYFKDNYRWLGFLGNLVIIVGCFLPYVTVKILGESTTSTFYSGDGKLVIATALLSMLLIMVNKRRIAAIPTLSNVFVSFWYPYKEIYKPFHELGNLVKYNFKIGFYIVIIGIIISIIYSILPEHKKNIRNS